MPKKGPIRELSVIEHKGGIHVFDVQEGHFEYLGHIPKTTKAFVRDDISRKLQRLVNKAIKKDGREKALTVSAFVRRGNYTLNEVENIHDIFEKRRGGHGGTTIT